jgi:predicted ATPase
VSNIQSIIRADIKQEKEGVFTLERGKLKIRLENAATGIKAFAIPLILLRKGWIRKNTLLILDEPEVHLHPIWQVRYVEIIIELVKRGIWVVTTTHSPYLLQAFEKFIEDNSLQEKASFYLLSRQDDSAVCENISGSLEKAYKLFVKPLEEILP